MPLLSPFRALRFATAAGDPRDLIAPPYDVIGAGLADELRSRSPYNSVRLVLPRGDGDDRYGRAAAELAAWRRDGILAEDPEPAVYAYRQRYEADGTARERLALFGALRLEEFGQGVLPHERTHAGPKRDRLALTLATRTQLSPIFLLARDPGASLLEALRAVTAGAPEVDATTPDGIEHALWRIAEEGAAAVLCALAGRHPLLIADGHHRYETALEVARQLEEPSADHVLACIVSDADPGLTIRATHRSLTRLGPTGELDVAELTELLEAWFDVTALGRLEAGEAAWLAAEDPAGMVVLPGGGEAFRLRPRPDGGEDDASPGERAALGLAAVRFDRHVMGDLLHVEADDAAHAGWLRYHRDAVAAVADAEPAGAAFLLPPVGLDAVWSATSDGIRLPPKSTYFEPKIPSGLLFRPL